MKNFYPTFKTGILGAMMLIMCVGASAQLKVDYKALPDFDKKMPVMHELGTPNGNAKYAKKQAATDNSAKSTRFVSSDGTESELPDHWNNALLKYYPPVFNQAGPSCMCSSFVGYIFTHELNSYRDLDASSPYNQMAVFFSWLQTFQNTSKEDFELNNGCPNAVDYGGRTNSDVIGYYDWHSREAGWMQGYEKWHRAMFNRAIGFYEFPKDVGTEEGREAVKRWIYNHNGDTDFLAGGACYVTLAATSVMNYIASTPANEAAGVVGKKYVPKWSDEINHAQTLVGWDDRVEFDLDENGVYGEQDKGEVGAWIICNSWGTGWGDGGFAYVPYKRGGPIGKVGNWFWNPYITYIRKDYRPLRTIKLLMDYTHRSELYLSVGVSADTAAQTPSYTLPMSAFKNAGDGAEDKSDGAPEVPMLGRYLDGLHHEPMEFGYDLTDLSSGFDLSKPLKYFFQVRCTSNKGTGHIYKASIMDYLYETENGTEIKFDIDTVVIGKDGLSTTYISVVVPGEAINPPTNVSIENGKLHWDNPQPTSLKIKKYYIYKNNVKVDSVGSTNKIYALSDLSGNYCVSAVYGYKKLNVESEKSNIARMPVEMPTGPNKVLDLANGSVVIPNAVPQQMNEATIEFFINPSELNGSNFHIGGTGDSNFFFELTTSGQARCGWNGENVASTTAKAIKANTWQHIAIVIQRNVMTLYVNGMKKSSQTSTTNVGLPALGDVLIGAYDGLARGMIDEFRIWKKARILAEIYSSKDYAISNPASQIDLVCYMPMNTFEKGGQTWIQEYANSNHAYFAQGNNSVKECTDILKGNTFKYAPSIILGDSIYATLPYQLVGGGSVTTTSWLWSVPGATPSKSELQSPYVTYSKPGTYTITLTTMNDKGEESVTEKEITVSTGVLPEPDFDITTPSQATAQAVSFINRTKGINCSYTWDIEGQGIQNLTNANAVFNTPGTYNVTLTATNSAGSASVTKTVDIYKARPTSKFNIAPNNIFLGETTYLEDKSIGDPTSWIWTLTNGKRYIQVDGQFSSLVPPAPGFYDVTLQTNNSEGGSISSLSKALCVMNADPKTGLNFQGNAEQIELERPFTAGRTSFTIEWWMNPTAYTGAGAFDLGDLKTDCSNLGSFSVTYKNKTNSYNNYIIRNEWHHYAITFAGAKITLYRDAEQMFTFDGTSQGTNPSWATKFMIGRTDHSYNGSIDELRIWNIALTKTQLQNVCNAPIENPENSTSLCTYYDFNQSGGDVIDHSLYHKDGKRINFGPDGDAWITSPGVFTLDFKSDIVKTDVSSQYLTNYKAPFTYNNVQINPNSRSSAYELQTETEKSSWVFKSPIVVSDNITQAVHVDTYYDSQLFASTAYNFGKIYNQRLYQTVSLPQGHYKFSITQGSRFYPETSRLVICFGDSIVNNENIEQALASCLLSNSQKLEFDIAEDNTNISLGVLYNMADTYQYMGIKSFNLIRYTSTTQEADGVGSAYEAVDKGLLGTFSGEVGAIRIVTNDLIDVTIYNTEGQIVFNNYVSGNKRIPMPAGIYIANGQKVIVK